MIMVYQLNNPNVMEAITAMLIFIGTWSVLVGFFVACAWLWKKLRG